MRTSLQISGLFIGLMLLLLMGCAAPTQQQGGEEAAPPPPSDDQGVEDELTDQVYVDLYATGADDWRDPWQPNVAPPARFDLLAGRSDEGERTTEQELEQAQGFRIQLADVLTQEDAKAARETALTRFPHVYITFRSPNYKVRAGNYLSRLDAEQEMSLARECGFRNAWIVPDWVYLNPPAPADSSAAMMDSSGVIQQEILPEQ